MLWHMGRMHTRTHPMTLYAASCLSESYILPPRRGPNNVLRISLLTMSQILKGTPPFRWNCDVPVRSLWMVDACEGHEA